MNNNDKFDYTYSAPTERERREIESIKNRYAPQSQKESKLELLRSLNKRVTRLPMIASLSSGVLGMLVLGAGMSMALVWELLVWGSVVGVVGIALIAAAYPIYKALLGRMQAKYGARIVELSDELLKGEENRE